MSYYIQFTIGKAEHTIHLKYIPRVGDILDLPSIGKRIEVTLVIISHMNDNEIDYIDLLVKEIKGK